MISPIFLQNYLSNTMARAINGEDIHVGDDVYRVSIDFQGILSLSRLDSTSPDGWRVAATPGHDCQTDKVPVELQVHCVDERINPDYNNVHPIEGLDITWTGDVRDDVKAYMLALTSRLINDILPALEPPPKNPISVEALREIEGSLRSTSTDLWALTVDDPETATIESEEAGMTPEREAIRDLRLRLDQLLISLEDLTNSTMTDSTDEPKTHTIVVLDDGETWAGGGCTVDLTQAEYDRIMEGEKVHDVAPDRCNYVYGPWAD